VEILRQAVDVLAETDNRLDHATALMDLGATLRRVGQPAAARAPLTEALDIARRLGATPLADIAVAELRIAGARPRRQAMTGVEALTASENRIAAMAVSGKSNRDIAQALFLTVKTVEMHLGHTYRKLGIAGRAELPRELGGAAVAT
jgi:DNA-binding CsgD family transcriptional regulator